MTSFIVESLPTSAEPFTHIDPDVVTTNIKVGEHCLFLKADATGVITTFLGDNTFSIFSQDPATVEDAIFDYLSEVYEDSAEFNALVDDSSETPTNRLLSRHKPSAIEFLEEIIPEAPMPLIKQFATHIVDNCISAL